jgi:hypothetical protein
LPSLFGLMQLLNVRGLRGLRVVLSKPASTSQHVSLTTENLGAWLVGVAAIPIVSLVVCAEELRGVVKAANQWAVSQQLPVPIALKVSVL